MKDKIKEQIKAAMDEIFLDWQAKLHVISGDVSPELAIIFDEKVDKLACLISIIIADQPRLGITKFTMLDGTEINLSKVELGYDEVQKLAEVERYLREKEIIQ